MDVACSTLSFSNEPLEQCLRHIAELEFQKVDLALGAENPQLTPAEVLADSALVIRRIRQGPTIHFAAVTLESPWETQDQAATMDGIAHFAKQIGAPVIALDAAPVDAPLDAEIQRLSALAKAALLHGCQLTVITKAGTLAETPESASRLCENVSGLGLTLDPSEFVYGPNQNRPYDQIFGWVRHAQLRDSGKSPDQRQVRVGRGEVEYGRIISSLKGHDYRGSLTVAFDRKIPTDFDIEPEVRKLRLLLESLL